MTAPTTSAGRLSAALAGDVVTPAVAGLTFVDPALLPGRGDVDPARALASMCDEMGLDFAFVPSWDPWALEMCDELRDAGVATAWVVEGVLWPALRAVGPDAGLRAVAELGRGADGPAADTLGAALDRALDACLLDTRRGLAAACDVLVVADDLAGAGGPLVAPSFVSGEVLARVREAAALARSAGMPPLLHSDGDVRPLLGDIRAAGFVGVHGDLGGAQLLAPAAEAMRAAAMTLVGGLPTAQLASPMTAVAAGTRAGVLAAAGRFIVADDGGVSTAGEVEALLAGLAAARV